MVEFSLLALILGTALAAAGRICWKDWLALKELRERERRLPALPAKKLTLAKQRYGEY